MLLSIHCSGVGLTVIRGRYVQVYNFQFFVHVLEIIGISVPKTISIYTFFPYLCRYIFHINL